MSGETLRWFEQTSNGNWVRITPKRAGYLHYLGRRVALMSARDARRDNIRCPGEELVLA